MIEQQAYTVKEMRKVLNIPEVTAYRLIKAGLAHIINMYISKEDNHGADQ